MTYTESADCYLGDVSSQVYEFLYRPRPCLFLNSHGHSWRGNPNFEHWNAGPVIERPEQLAAALRQTRENHAEVYLPIQQQMLARSFDVSERPSSQRAAQALLQFMERKGLSSMRRGRAAA